MTKNNIDEKIKNKIKKLYLSGYTPKQIKEELNVSWTAKEIGSYLSRENIVKKKKEISKKKEAILVEKLPEVLAEKEIKKIVDYSETNEELLKKIATMLRTATEAKDVRALASALKDSHVINRLEKGQSTENIEQETKSTNLNIAIEDKEAYDKWTRLLNNSGK